MKKRKAVALIGLVLSCSSLMIGCSVENDTSASSSDKFLSNKDETYKLAYFELGWDVGWEEWVAA